ncbi:flavin reductase family protein [Bradyrhizobium sp. CSA112]|uniref:flavin reductase family protein n=1 Tax=Bradyrhizobium sp. CSA112 TaxID=2699170 RepID=UPI0023B0FBDB|nr:flavin reductase family protein [Bradyrhizobium sp. CSA112]
MSCQSPPRISDIQSIEAIEFRQAMRNLASGVSIVATGTAVRRRGLTVSSITSICMDPPCLLVCINASSETHDAILTNGTFGVSLLGGNQQDLALRFAGRHGANAVHRFDTAPWDQGVLDVPVLQSAVCVLECVLHHHQLVGTHGDLYRPDCRDAISSRQSTHQLPWRTSNVTVRLSAGFHRNVAIRNDTLRLRLC